MKERNFITIDTETTSLYGVIVLIQYAYGPNGEIKLYCPWKHTVQETIDLIESFVNHEDGILAFNASFDHFHLCKMYTTCLLIKDKMKLLEDCIEEFALAEPTARDGPCLKPVSVCDVFLWARKSHYQSLMERKDIKIRKVPSVLALPLCKELEKRVPLKDIYFARKSDPSGPRWKCYPIKDIGGDFIEGFCDIKVKFAPSSALKALAADALDVNIDSIIKYKDITTKLYSQEPGYAPFALSIGTVKDWKGTWPEYIRYHIRHWETNEDARQYAADDIKYTRSLYKYFGCPDFDDDDSVLACSIAACRWKGFAIDIEGIKHLKEEVKGRRYKNGYKIPTAPRDVKRYIFDALDETEKTCFQGSTGKVALEEMATKLKVACPNCKGESGLACIDCKSTGFVEHEAARRIKEVLTARQVDKEIELYDKLLLAGRFMPDFKVIGTLSSRMAGASGLNAQAIKSTKTVKSRFPLIDEGYVLCGADFDAFEISIAIAVYNDKNLQRELLTCEKCKGEMIFDAKATDYKCGKCGSNKGQKIHALLGVTFFPGMTYEQVKATANTDNDLYTAAKRGVFALLYGGEAATLERRIGISLQAAEVGFQKFLRQYPGVAKARQKVIDALCTMKQIGGIGTRVTWADPKDHVETLLGFKRYFELENRICKTLFDLANKVPQAWRNIKLKVQRRERIQTPGGAVSSALYAAAFAIQAANMRAGNNHVIQGTGAQITKGVQRKVWDVQPSGVNKWIVQPINVHDQVMCSVHPDYVEKVKAVVHDAVESYRPLIPLIKFEWQTNLKSWADKGEDIWCHELPKYIDKYQIDANKKVAKVIKEHLSYCFKCKAQHHQLFTDASKYLEQLELEEMKGR